MPAIAHVDPRFQSYNIEMVEVIGGRFWKPYSATSSAQPAITMNGNTATLSSSLFEQRKPVDLSDPRLRKLAAALGPAYVRVSGSWANSLYFQNSDAPAPTQPPPDFGGTLTRAEWKGVIDFVHAVDGKLVTSFAVSKGTRDASGAWTTTQAQAFLNATQEFGGSIAATEFINEPTIPFAAGLPPDYNGEAFGRDYATFRTWLRKASPHTILLGPSSTAEGGPPSRLKLLPSTELLQGMGPNSIDAFSYHFYGAISQRCAAGLGASAGTSPDAALTADWLDRTAATEAFYANLRDKYEPGKPIWVTETGQAACGGDRWASTFLDSFRYLDQLGRLAQKDVQVVMHNTLDASDYGLIDERTLTPRPNYWAAVLWHRTMGTTVLDPGPAPTPDLRLYAQCAPDKPGGVTLLALNLSRTAAAHLHLDKPSARYTLTAPELESHEALLNNQPLTLTASGDLPPIDSTPQPAGDATLAPASITFFVVPSAGNKSCIR